MNELIISRMSDIVAEVMTSFQSDFEDYDKPYIAKAQPDQFPMLWFVAPTHTYLFALGEYEAKFNEHESIRWSYAQNGNPFISHIESLSRDKIFLVTTEEVREINQEQAREVCRDIVTPIVVKWKEQNGPLPTKFRLPIKFSNITLAKIKELLRECEEHNDTSLIDALHRFRNYRRVATDQYIHLSYSPRYNEFTFSEHINGETGLVGGLVFHGWKETGYLENGSVQLTPHYGWSTHT